MAEIKQTALFAPVILCPLFSSGSSQVEDEEEEEEEVEEEVEELTSVQVSEKEFNFLDYMKRLVFGNICEMCQIESSSSTADNVIFPGHLLCKFWSILANHMFFLHFFDY